MFCSALQCVAVCCSDPHFAAATVKSLKSQCVAVFCSVLQCSVVCCSVLQCVAVCCSESHFAAATGATWSHYAHTLGISEA